MTTFELLTLTRTLLRDTALPPKWTDEDIVMYLNEAQEKVCRTVMEFVVADYALPVYEGIDAYDIDEDIQLVYRVHLDGVAGTIQPSTDGHIPTTQDLGVPITYTLDSSSRSIRFWPVPREDYTAIMRVARLPAALTVDDIEARCELESRYQIPLADWAAYRCFTHDDADGRNDGAAKLAKDRYEEAVMDHKQDVYRFRTGSALRVCGNRVI